MAGTCELENIQAIDSKDVTPDIASAVNNLALQLATLENLMTYDSKSPEDKNGGDREKAARHLAEMFCTKPFSPLHISELFNQNSLAPVEIQMVCGTTPEDFSRFLKQSKDFFIVTGEHVLPRKNIPQKDWAPSYKSTVSHKEVLLNFFKSYTSHGKPVLVEKLYRDVGKHFLNDNGEELFPSFEELSKFLGMFPDIFYVFDLYVTNILINSDFDEKLTSGGCQNKSVGKQTAEIPEVPDVISDEMLLLKKDILCKTELISDLETCRQRTKKILHSENVISLDCEGYKLGPIGRICLLQVGLQNGDIYIFDILAAPEMMIEGYLVDIFQSKDILKVLHDCRNDTANLYNEFKVKLCNIYDTRIAHEIITGRTNDFIGLNNLCQTYNVPVNFEKDKFKKIFKSNPRFWLDRPLTEDSLAYAALDALCIMEAYKNLQKESSLLESDVVKKSEAVSLACR